MLIRTKDDGVQAPAVSISNRSKCQSSKIRVAGLRSDCPRIILQKMVCRGRYPGFAIGVSGIAADSVWTMDANMALSIPARVIVRRSRAVL